jgi:hypothetical protein
MDRGGEAVKRVDLRNLNEAATPAPWTADGLTMRSFMVWDGRGDDLLRAWLEADATLIAAMRNALPSFLDMADAVERGDLVEAQRILGFGPEPKLG